jgi:hypothetical protein
MGDTLDGHAMAKHSELESTGKDSTGARKKWWRQRSKDLVNSKNKRVCP